MPAGGGGSALQLWSRLPEGHAAPEPGMLAVFDGLVVVLPKSDNHAGNRADLTGRAPFSCVPELNSRRVPLRIDAGSGSR